MIGAVSEWIGGGRGSAPPPEVAVPSKEQVNALIAQGLDYPEIGRRLAVPPGQAYLIGTGTPADGGHSTDESESRPGVLSSAQHLVNPPHENPTSSQVVHDWIAGRVAADEQMRWAGAARKAREQAQKRRDG
jgi:hypothetical protein